MARPKTEFRNELKTRVTDRTYDALQQYILANRCSSESRATSELLELALFGRFGTLPANYLQESRELEISRPLIRI